MPTQDKTTQTNSITRAGTACRSRRPLGQVGILVAMAVLLLVIAGVSTAQTQLVAGLTGLAPKSPGALVAEPDASCSVAQLHWSRVRRAHDYRIEVSSDGAHWENLTDTTGGLSSWRARIYRPGEPAWFRVVALSQRGQIESEPSARTGPIRC